jgi:DHA1 family bicyclomycin/chloramphenicol resistance-like MFS transporter
LNIMPVASVPSRGWILTILVLAAGASIMSTDLYAPSLAHLPAYFGASKETVQLTISLNLLAFGAAQLIHGPLSDRFGRRPVLILGMSVFFLASLACALAASVEQLIAARVLQGASAAVEAVVALAILRDVFDEPARIRALAIFGMAVAVAPAVAPLIGGWMHVLYGWRSNFYLIAAAALVVVVLVARTLPETRERAALLAPSEVLRTYRDLCRDRRFIGYTLICAVGLGMIFAFVATAPFIIITDHGVPTERYGIFHGTVVVAFFLGSMLANRLAGALPARLMLRSGLFGEAAGVGALAALVIADVLTPWGLTLAMSLALAGMGLVFAVGPARAMEVADAPAGIASALYGTLEMLTAGIAAAIVSLLHDDAAVSLTLTLTLLLGASFWFERVALAAEAETAALS